MIRTFFILIFLSFFSDSYAAEVSLAWDPVEPQPDGYRLYMRTDVKSYDYETAVWSGQETSTVVPDVPVDITSYFVVRAYVGDAESVDSNEVTFTPTTGTVGDGDDPSDDPGAGDDPPDGPVDGDDSDTDDSDIDAPTSLQIQEIIGQLDRIEADVDLLLEIVEAHLTSSSDIPDINTAPFCGNPDSKIVHSREHWCGSNAVTFQTMDDALGAGYRACGVCKPE